MSRGQNITVAVLIAVVFAFILHAVFSVHRLDAIYSVMTITFLLGLPFGMGYLTVYLCKNEFIEYASSAFFIPFAPIFIFFLLTLFLNIEGAACWLMILPIFLILSGLGGLTARYFKFKKRDKGMVYIVLLLPFFLSPI